MRGVFEKKSHFFDFCALQNLPLRAKFQKTRSILKGEHFQLYRSAHEIMKLCTESEESIIRVALAEMCTGGELIALFGNQLMCGENRDCERCRFLLLRYFDKRPCFFVCNWICFLFPPLFCFICYI